MTSARAGRVITASPARWWRGASAGGWPCPRQGGRRPGDHGVAGEVVARDVGRRMGLPAADVDLVASAVRLHLLLPMVATRRDLDDPVTVKQVATAVRSRALLELLHALAISDGLATGPAAWNDWKATLVADLVRRVESVLDGDPMPAPAPLREDQLALARGVGWTPVAAWTD